MRGRRGAGGMTAQSWLFLPPSREWGGCMGSIRRREKAICFPIRRSREGGEISILQRLCDVKERCTTIRHCSIFEANPYVPRKRKDIIGGQSNAHLQGE